MFLFRYPAQSEKSFPRDAARHQLQIRSPVSRVTQNKLWDTKPPERKQEWGDARFYLLQTLDIVGQQHEHA